MARSLRDPSDQKQEAKVLQRVAQKLGLGFSAAHGAMTPARAQGEVDGRPLSVTGRTRDESLGLAVWTACVPRLDLGLDVGGRGALSMIAESFREQSDFDLQFAIEADEPARAETLLVPTLRSALKAAGARLDDASIELEAQGTGASGFSGLPTTSQVLASVREALRIAGLVDEAWKSVPPASRLAGHAREWSALSTLHHLEYSNTPLRLAGKVGRTGLAARADRTAPNTYSIAMSAMFESPLRIGLSVRQAGLLDKVKSVFQPDIQLGDAEFDRGFLVAAEQADAAKAALDSDVRQHLLSMARLGAPPVLGDAGLNVSFPSDALSVEASVEVIGRLVEVSERVWENVAGAARRGAYR